MSKPFACLPIGEVQPEPTSQTWLIESLWTRSAVGILGGPPKCCKSWLGLDMALSVASASACLDRFEVTEPGPVLIYMAEDSLPAVQKRIQGICAHRGIELAGLNLFVIDTPSLRLDQTADQNRLIQAVEEHRPRMLLLDPLVRLHGLDENSSQDMSRLLGLLRELQRRFDMAVVLVHHTSKKARSHTGQALRGSSELHAWTDSSMYLTRKNVRLQLTLEHRGASALAPLFIELVSNGSESQTYLKVLEDISEEDPARKNLHHSVIALIDQAPEPMTRAKIREQLKIRNQSLGLALADLEAEKRIKRTHAGWVALK